ncbi:uncharacterized protein LOC135816630 [Sycon ciliatum]|uniref:uncharacterized protein LOC135816630 n=1 Tax=Sycon ciliatum TaxID=27933 RepID=UPI0031F64DBB
MEGFKILVCLLVIQLMQSTSVLTASIGQGDLIFTDDDNEASNATSVTAAPAAGSDVLDGVSGSGSGDGLTGGLFGDSAFVDDSILSGSGSSGANPTKETADKSEYIE